MNDAAQNKISTAGTKEVLSILIEENKLPLDGDFLSGLQNSDGLFIEDESLIHDYKREYPFSVSDSNFGGILRLICAFHNSFGGLIIFGVDDKERNAGRNKVKIDAEKINRKLRESLTRKILISHKRYHTATGEVDVLLVPKRTAKTPPVRFSKSIGGYEPHRVYLRKGAEVLDAQGHDIEYLYGQRSNPFLPPTEAATEIESALPGSPATIREFVGRFDVIERIHDWLTHSREPRLFIWGHGGSGKSTIAYEFGKTLSGIGRVIKNKQGNPFDRVIFISAKRAYLDPYSAKIGSFQGTDFETAEELFKSILTLSHWAEQSTIDSYTEDECISALEELLEIETQLLIIDDIDTLTSRDEDAGMEQLFGILARCRSGSKALYTQRNIPLYARKSSIEVPGLNERDEYPEFLKICSDQFKVPIPLELEQTRIAEISECRPLAIETILGLRRITSSYSDAINRWTSDASQAREYLFQREYDQLSKENRGRYLLAALAVFGEPVDISILDAVLQFSREQIQDAIAESRDMFLKIEYSTDGTGDKYSLGAATRLFLINASKKLDRFPTIEAKIRILRSETKLTPPALFVFLERARRHLENGEANAAWTFMKNANLPSAVVEHPDFKAVLGIVATSLNPPKITEARESFEAAFSMGHRHYLMYQRWLWLERDLGAGTTRGLDMCLKVVNSTGFNARTQANFSRQLAYLQVLRAKEVADSSPSESSDLRDQAVLSNIGALLLARKGGDPALEAYAQQANDSIEITSRLHSKTGDFDRLLSLFEKILEIAEPIDLVVPTLLTSLETFVRRVPVGSRHAVRTRLGRIAGRANQKGFLLLDEQADRSAIVSRIKAAQTLLT